MKNRITRLAKLLTEQSLDAILVSSTPAITYLTNYSGFSTIEREAYLLITKNKQYIFTDGRYTEAVNDLPGFTLIEISATKSLIGSLMELAKKHAIKKLGVEENNLTVSEYKKIKKCFITVAPISLHALRIIKEESEIKEIENACRLGDETFTHVLKKIKKGVTEKELAVEIELFIKKAGADISFTPIVAFGKNAAIPHHQTSNQPLASSGQFVLLDFGAKINNYCSDMTRTIFFGKPTNEQKHMYQIVLDAQNHAIDFLNHESGIRNHKPIKASDVDKAARGYITSQGFPSIPHSLGHGIGLEVHEAPNLSPNSKTILKPGMVFSIEPGIYLPNVGGVRIEDLVVLEKSGLRLLTKSPRQLQEI